MGLVWMLDAAGTSASSRKTADHGTVRRILSPLARPTAAGKLPQVERPTWGPPATVEEAPKSCWIQGTLEGHWGSLGGFSAASLRPCKVRRERLELHGELVKAVRKGDLAAVASLAQWPVLDY